METSELATLTHQELEQLHIILHRGIVRLYDRASAIYIEMGDIPTDTPAYAEMGREAKLLRAAAEEQCELNDQVRAARFPEIFA